MSEIIDAIEKKSILTFNPFIYFSAGEALNDKDRDNNIDSKLIQKFFQPIDNLFGDYEVRKKFGNHNLLYLKKMFKDDGNNLGYFIIDEKSDFKLEDLQIDEKENDFKLFIKNDKDEIIQNITKKSALLIFILFYDYDSTSIKIDCFLTDNLINKTKSEYIGKINGTLNNTANIVQIFALDPEKLIQCVDMDEARQEHFKKEIVRNEEIDKDVVDYFIMKVNIKKSINIDDFDIYNNNSLDELMAYLEIDDNLEPCKKLAKLFLKRAYKLKKFEPHCYFKARVGYENNHFVLFLHPHESESNNPIRFPPQE